MKELVQRIIEFRNERNWKQFHTPENLAKSISIEAAELLEHFQWGQAYDVTAVSYELADVMNYCFLMADALGIDIVDVMHKKIDQNALKYPVEKAKGVSTKYSDL